MTRFVMAVVIAAAAGSATARIDVAVFGDNDTDDFINSLGGYTATLVTDADLATPGFLNSFDILYYTRDGSSFGVGLSAGAAAEVSAWVQGRYVLFNGDHADSIGPSLGGPDAVNVALQTNALAWVAGGGGGGYIGEFSGTYSAFATNGGGYTALGLVPGDASGINAAWDMNTNAVGVHPITTGAGLPANIFEQEWASVLTGYDASTVIAEYDDRTPAILAGQIPAPGAMAALGLAGLVASRRRRA